MSKLIQNQVETLRTLQARLRAVHDEIHDVLQPGGDANALTRSLQSQSIGFDTGFVALLQSIASNLYAADAFLHSQAVNLGDYSLPTGPTVYERARARREAAELVAV